MRLGKLSNDVAASTDDVVSGLVVADGVCSLIVLCRALVCVTAIVELVRLQSPIGCDGVVRCLEIFRLGVAPGLDAIFRRPFRWNIVVVEQKMCHNVLTANILQLNLVSTGEHMVVVVDRGVVSEPVSLNRCRIWVCHVCSSRECG